MDTSQGPESLYIEMLRTTAIIFEQQRCLQPSSRLQLLQATRIEMVDTGHQVGDHRGAEEVDSNKSKGVADRKLP
jgi:hypothetical protein